MRKVRVYGKWFFSEGEMKRVQLVHQEGRMPTVEYRHGLSEKAGLHYERQTSVIEEHQPSVMEIYGKVGYAEGEKKALWDLPGHGRALVDCGKIIVLGCDNVEKHPDNMNFGRMRKNNCRRKQCPTCFEGWATAEGERSLIRLASSVVGVKTVRESIFRLKVEKRKEPRQIFHKALTSELEVMVNSKHGRKPIHVVLSPPEGLIDETVKGYRFGRRMAYRIAKESGLIGGCVVFHPYRLKCAKCGGTIEDYRKQCSECGCSDFEWFFSPHFHVVAFGWLSCIKEGYLRHGWVVKGLGVRESVFWTMRYLLSHAGVSTFFHATTWFGELAYNRLIRVVKNLDLREICPYCEKTLIPMKWTHGLDRPPDLEYSEEDPYLNEFLADKEDWRVF